MAIGAVAASWLLVTAPIDISPIVIESREASQFLNQEPLNGEPVSSITADDTFLETFSRPLFSPTRRKYQPPKPKPKPPVEIMLEPSVPVAKLANERRVATPPKIHLFGVSMSGETSRALVLIDANSDPVWLFAGDSVGTWTLSEIHLTAITVVSGSNAVSIGLYPEDR